MLNHLKNVKTLVRDISQRLLININFVAALGPRKSLFGPVSQPTAAKERSVTYGSGFVATASEAGGPGKCFVPQIEY